MIHIVTPVYDGEDWIAETIESVLAQTDPNWTYVLVDDGSRDGTAAVIEQYLSDPRIHLVRQENTGVAGALNRGLEPLSADASLVALLGADDIWEPTYLERMRDALDAHPAWGLAWCELRCFGAETGLYRGDRPPVVGSASETIARIYTDVTFLGSGTICRAAPFHAGLRFPDFRVMEDVHVWAAIAANAEIGHVPEPLVRYRVHARSLSTSSGSMLRNLRWNVASYRQLYRDFRTFIPRRLYRWRMWWAHHYAAEDAMHLGRTGVARSLCALRYRPLHAPTWKNLAKGIVRRVRGPARPRISSATPDRRESIG